MALIKRKAIPDLNVVQAAQQRIKNVFANGTKVYISFSGGKDSIVLLDLVYKLALAGEIDPKQIVVMFIDEEAMYDCVIDICKDWRKKIMLIGGQFLWFCVETRNYNCLNSLEDDENFIYWDRYKRDVWIRPMPEFAITSHPLLRPRKDTYQEFLGRLQQDGICLCGVRWHESVQRMQYMAAIMSGKKKMTGRNMTYPIYDMDDRDVWKYIKDNNLDYPIVYQYMYQAGISINHLRISQFFAIDTVRCLSKMYEYFPDLAERVQRREPNAYLVQLYFDTDMFRRKTKKNKELTAEEEDTKDYKALFFDVVNHPDKYFQLDHTKYVAAQYRKTVLKYSAFLTDADYKALYTSLMAGDTKMRTLRRICTDINIREAKKTNG